MNFPAGYRQRFFSKAQKTATGCWLWPVVYGGNKGYARAFVAGRRHPAHRIAYALEHGPISNGLIVCHRCDVRNCVNPAHLFVGTDADNARDRDEKGRGARHDGLHNGRAKLTPDAIETMRALRDGGATYRDLGRRFGVSDVAARLAIIGATWRSAA